MNSDLSFHNRLYGLVISRLNWPGSCTFRLPSYWMQSSWLHCNLDTPFKTWSLHIPSRLGHCIYCVTVRIAVSVNATILGYRLKKDATSSQNMGRFGPWLVRPGRFGLIFGVGRFSRKKESFRPWVDPDLDRFSLISIGCIVWCKDRVGLWYKWQCKIC